MRTCENPCCQGSMAHKRRGARFCGEGCRREANTIKALQAGRPSAGYRTLSEFMSRRRRRGGSVAAGALRE